MDRKNDNLQQLGHEVAYPDAYTPGVLEAFENQHPEHDYWVEFLCPEFTTLCPITGSPISRRYASCISPTTAWWKARA